MILFRLDKFNKNSSHESSVQKRLLQAAIWQIFTTTASLGVSVLTFNIKSECKHNFEKLFHAQRNGHIASEFLSQQAA